VPAVELVVTAIRLDRQGTRLEDGEPLIEYISNELVAHALDTHGGEVVSAVIHADNERSLNAAARMGLDRHISEAGRYIRVAGRFVATP